MNVLETNFDQNITEMKVLAPFSSAIQTHSSSFEPPRPNRSEFLIFLIPTPTDLRALLFNASMVSFYEKWFKTLVNFQIFT